MSIVIIPEVAQGGGGTSLIVQDEGTPLTQRSNIDFIGAGVTAADDPANSRTTVTIPGGAVGLLTEYTFQAPVAGEIVIVMRSNGAHTLTHFRALIDSGTSCTVNFMVNGVDRLTTALSVATTSTWTESNTGANGAVGATADGDTIAFHIVNPVGNPGQVAIQLEGT